MRPLPAIRTLVSLALLAGGLLFASPSARGEWEIVQFRSADGVNLVGDLYRAEKRDNRGLVLVHMLGSNRRSWVPLAEEAQKRGITVLAFDLRGHGNSVYYPNGEEDDSVEVYEFTDEMWATTIRDVSAAVRYLSQVDEVNPEKVILGGASIGANLALKYAAADDVVKALFLMSPGKEYRGIETLDPVNRYGERPLFLMASTEEGYSTQSLRILETLSPSEDLKVELLDGNRHGTALFNTIPGLEEDILDWLNTVTEP